MTTNGARDGRAGPWLAGLAVGLLLLTASEQGARRLQREEDLRIAAQFAASAAGWREAIQREADLFIEVLESLRHLHTLSAAVSREAFAEFEAKGLAFAQSELGGFGFAQRVTRSTRPAFEAPGEGRTLITEAGAGDWLQPAVDRDEWYPVVHTRPSELAPRGFNLASVAGQAGRIADAVRAGRTVVGAPFLSPDPLLLSPIVELTFDATRNAYAAEPRGVAFAWLQPQRLLERALPAAAAGRVQAELRPPRTDSAFGSADGEPDFAESVRIADQRWMFRVRARAGFRAEQRSGHASSFRLVGLLLAVLGGGLAGGAAGYARRVEQLVRVRTAALEHEREERARLEHELLEVGRRERQQVGQDLHDSLGQKLAGAALLARAAARGTGEQAPAQMHQVADVLKDSLAQVRRIARGLAPLDLDNAQLADALRRLADEVCDLHGVVCAVEAAPDVRPRGAGTALHLYQITQEAIANALRHGGATEIRVRLARSGAVGELSIEDNGSGLPADATRQGGLGLRLMRHRAALFGGAMELAPAAGRGTIVRCCFPLDPA